jgi:hypothetical protein
MIYGKQVEQLATRPMKDMSIHSKRKIEVYRSSNPELTGEYYGKSFKDSKEPAFFELAFFEYEWGKSQIFLRYPHTDFFIEMTGGTGSSWGNMTSTGGRNYTEEEISETKDKKAMFELFKHDTHAMLSFSGFVSFNFLTKVKDTAILAEVFSRKFLPLPDKRQIVYAYVTSDNKYIIQDRPVTNGIPSRTWFGSITEGLKLAQIENHVTYRDGGTTYFDMIIDGVTHKFYSPTPFNQELKATLDGNVIKKVDDETIRVLAVALGIELETKKAE